MKTTVASVITEEEPCLLKGVQIRLLLPEERERFDQLIDQQHYLGNAQLVGERVGEDSNLLVKPILDWGHGQHAIKALFAGCCARPCEQLRSLCGSNIRTAEVPTACRVQRHFEVTC